MEHFLWPDTLSQGTPIDRITFILTRSFKNNYYIYFTDKETDLVKQFAQGHKARQ